MDKISGVLFFSAFLPYIWAILNGETQPSPVSWAIWASVDTLALAAMIKKGAAVGQLTGATAGAWLVVVLALYFGEPTMGSVEWVSIVGAVTGVVLWKTTGSATTAIVSSQAAIMLGAFPTFVAAYHNPAQENPVAWTIWFLSCIFAFKAVKKWDLDNALQPITFTVVEGIMVYLVVIRPLF